MMADNAGTELLADLALVDMLLGHGVGVAEKVRYHVKGQPFFVSDTLAADVDHALDALEQGGSQTAALAARLRGYREEGRLELATHWAYASSLFYFQTPSDLRAMWAAADLVILKGDANYRRLIGDLHWPPDESFESVTAYFPAPLLAVRTLKSDPVAGLSLGLAERLDRADPEWRVNGVRGVIQANLRMARPAPA